MFDYSGRLFTFGCSFTEYIWPTWANVLGKEFNYFENWGKQGSGNQYILHSLVECHKLKKLVDTDTVIIMWTTPNRRDDYVNGEWISQIYKTPLDLRGDLLITLNLIYTVRELLNTWNINYKFLAMTPCNSNNDFDLIELFNDVLEFIPQSMFNTVYKSNWYVANGNFRTFSPAMDENKKTKKLKEYYDMHKGSSWPSFKEFLNNDISDQLIFNELEDLGLIFMRDNPIRIDWHPTPEMHLQYLRTVFPELVIKDETVKWVNDYKLNDLFDSHYPKNRL
jgi:hypothetical protein